MINPKELRIGNYIFSKETCEPQIVTAIGEDYVCFDSITFDYTELKDIDPLPITDELFDLALKSKSIGVVKIKGDYFYCMTKLDYVHELQNVYFAITKTELI